MATKARKSEERCTLPEGWRQDLLWDLQTLSRGVDKKQWVLQEVKTRHRWLFGQALKSAKTFKLMGQTLILHKFIPPSLSSLDQRLWKSLTGPRLPTVKWLAVAVQRIRLDSSRVFSTDKFWDRLNRKQRRKIPQSWIRRYLIHEFETQRAKKWHQSRYVRWLKEYKTEALERWVRRGLWMGQKIRILQGTKPNLETICDELDASARSFAAEPFEFQGESPKKELSTQGLSETYHPVLRTISVKDPSLDLRIWSKSGRKQQEATGRKIRLLAESFLGNILIFWWAIEGSGNVAPEGRRRLNLALVELRETFREKYRVNYKKRYRRAPGPTGQADRPEDEGFNKEKRKHSRLLAYLRGDAEDPPINLLP